MATKVTGLSPLGKKVLAAFIVVFAILALVRFRNKVAPPRPEAAPLAQGAFVSSPSADGAVRAPTTPDDLGRPLRVAINTWGGYAPGLVENGGRLAPSATAPFARNHGLQVEFVLIDDFAQSRDAFRSERVDVLWATVDSFALEAPGLAALHPKVFLQFDYSHGGDAMAATAAIRSAADLRGKRVAYAAGTPSQYLLLYVLTNAGLSLSDVNRVETASAPEAATLFKNGSVDAAVSWDPDVTNAAHAVAGGHILVSTAQADHLIADVFYTRAAFIAAHPQTLQRFVAGWFEGVRTVRADSAAGARALSSALTGVPLEDAQGMLANAALTDYRDNRTFFNVDGNEPVNFTSIFHNAAGVWRSTGQLAQVAQAHDHVDTSVLAAIQDQMAAVEVPRSAGAPPSQARAFATTDGGAAPSQAIVTRRMSIFFPTGSTALDDNAEYALNQVAEFAATFGGSRMRVVGNTDNVGDPEANRRLSEARARAVVEWLVTHHQFDRSRFDVEGAGASRPVAPNTTDAGRRRNRRTDFEILAPSVGSAS